LLLITSLKPTYDIGLYGSLPRRALGGESRLPALAAARVGQQDRNPSPEA
jgi:hypothetical protein